jgi:hypothetical protein
MRALACLLAALLAGIAPLSAQVNIRQEQVILAEGQSAASLKGTINGAEVVDYLVPARAGQSLVATLKARNPSAYFNVLPPKSDEAIFVGSSSGNRFEGTLPAEGVYTLRVYLMRNAARRKETTSYTLDLALPGTGKPAAAASKPAPGPGNGFDRTLSLQGIGFRVTSSNDRSLNELRIVPTGLEIDNAPIVRAIDGTVTGAEVADLNADGSPEIYVYVTSAGSGGYGSLVAYSANRRKSLSEIYLPPIPSEAPSAKGYRGHDEFAVVENVLARRFPIYRDSDANAKATGGMRQLQYRLFPGEAGWILKLDRMVEF